MNSIIIHPIELFACSKGMESKVHYKSIYIIKYLYILHRTEGIFGVLNISILPQLRVGVLNNV